MSPRSCVAVLLFVLALLLAGCGECQETTSKAGRFELVEGSTFSVGQSEEGVPLIEATIPEGNPGAGTYRTTAKALLDDAQYAMGLMGKEGATVRIEVDDTGEIVKVIHEVVTR